jgi:hypothetical protein
MTHAIPTPSTIGFSSGTNKKKAGRPKDSSVQAARQRDTLKEVLINEIATE